MEHESKHLQTHHRVVLRDCRAMPEVADESVQLVITSPPYPMVSMWDEVFASLDDEIDKHLADENGNGAFERMHQILDSVWSECARVLVPGGLLCINIGDATRSIKGEFARYPNAARITSAAMERGLTCLPDILWRKPTNAPNKFMGSGMLPGGAYVTYEHEYILIFRKCGKRSFATVDEKTRRRESAYFWEERNVWFSDIWIGLRGAQQALANGSTRERSAAFPLELPHRLVLMFSSYGDLVLDPFAGTGTTLAAAMALGRSSVGYEIAPDVLNAFAETADAIPELSEERVRARLTDHLTFVSERVASGREVKHHNARLKAAVMTRQEAELVLLVTESVRKISDTEWIADHAEFGNQASRVAEPVKRPPRQTSTANEGTGWLFGDIDPE